MRMNVLALIPIMTVCCLGSAAPAEPQSLASLVNFSGFDHTGGFFTPVARQGDMLGQKAAVFGARVGFIFNDSVLLGFGGYKLGSRVVLADANEVTANDAKRFGLAADPDGRFMLPQERRFDFSYGGLVVGYNFFPDKLVNCTVIANFGLGSTRLDRIDGEDYSEKSEYDPVQVIEPEAYAEINLSRAVRLGAGASYRFVRSVDEEKYSSADLEGPTGMVTFTLVERR